ncbi:MAG: site-2 protease family protein [bacterium]
MNEPSFEPREEDASPAPIHGQEVEFLKGAGPARPAGPGERAERDRRSWRRAAVLFLITVVSVFYVPTQWLVPPSPGAPLDFLRGWVFAVPLLFILLCHEFGHYIMARRHGVDVSPPYFLPFPSIIGTMGAFISIRSQIYNRRALLDIGAAGPIAGFLPAVILLFVGYGLSGIGTPPVPSEGETVQYLVFGENAVTLLARSLVFGELPPGHDIVIHPVGFAAWVGLLVTMLNLLPLGMLDGGHISYAALGKRQWKAAPWLLAAVAAMGVLIHYWWLMVLVFFGVVLLVGGLAARWVYKVKIPFSALYRGRVLKHPPVPNEEPLDPVRRGVALLCLVIFLLCFLPVPIEIVTVTG